LNAKQAEKKACMAYAFKYTEKNNKKASDFEAKGLLYLIGIDKDSKRISLVFIDCFNDITGTNIKHSNLWDMQSKGVANMSPSLIGRSLATLFLNFCSDFPFKKFALLTPIPNPDYLHRSKEVEFGIDNFKPKQIKSIESGIRKEISDRNVVIQNGKAAGDLVKAFLNDVRFIVDAIPTEEYVKAIIEFKDKDLKPAELYNAIFEEIKVMQVAKKISSIHGMEVTTIAEVLNFKRHISSLEISQLLVNRLVGVDLFRTSGIPFSFQSEIVGKNSDEVKDIVLECNSNVCKAFFDKSKKRIFWAFLENILTALSETPNRTSREIYDVSSTIHGLEYSDLNGISGIYFISLIKDGLSL
jgi:hypothetical protein